MRKESAQKKHNPKFLNFPTVSIQNYPNAEILKRKVQKLKLNQFTKTKVFDITTVQVQLTMSKLAIPENENRNVVI